MEYAHEFVDHAVMEALHANPSGTDLEILQAAYDRASFIYRDQLGTPQAFESGVEAYDAIGTALDVLGVIHRLRKPEA